MADTLLNLCIAFRHLGLMLVVVVLVVVESWCVKISTKFEEL